MAPCVAAAASALCCALGALIAFILVLSFQALGISVPFHVRPAISPGGLRRVVEADGSHPCLAFCWRGVWHPCFPGGERILGLAPFPSDKGGEFGLCCRTCSLPATCPSSPAILSAASCSSRRLPRSAASLSPPYSATESHKRRQTLGVFAGFLCFSLLGD